MEEEKTITQREQLLVITSAIILGGMAANYHHNLIPATYWTAGAVELADHLLKTLDEKPPKVSE